MSAVKLLSLAGVLVAGTVSALVYLGRGDGETSSAQGAQVASPPSATKSTDQDPSPATDASSTKTASGGAIAHGARALVPKEAWLVADFRGDLTGTRPFEDQEGLCKSVPAPPRVALGVLPPRSAASGGGPELLLAAPAVDDTFWGCARDRIVRSGGKVLAQNAQFEVLESPSGIVALGPGRSMIFLTNQDYLERGLSVLANLEESAASTGVHAGLFRRMHPSGDLQNDTALDLTIHVPRDWLSSVGKDAELTPLRHLQAGFLSVKQDGSAIGGIDCVEPGCKEMFEFLEGAKGDLTAQLPATQRAAIEAALSIDYVDRSGRVILRWSPKDLRIQDLLGGFLSGPGMFAP